MLGGSSLDKAFFLYQHALDSNWMFQMTLNYKFRGKDTKVVGNIKHNLMRIAQKIHEKNGRVKGENDKTFRVTDMIRASILVQDLN